MGSTPRLASAVLPKSDLEQDPLHHVSTDVFWWHVDRYFEPITREDVALVRSIDEELSSAPCVAVPDCGAGTSEACADTKPATPTTKADKPPDPSSLRSYPLTQRLLAALLDEGKGAPCAAKTPPRLQAGSSSSDTFWTPCMGESQKYYELLERRVSAELNRVGLIDESDASNDELARAMAMGNFRLQSISASTRTTERKLAVRAAREAMQQSERRSSKRQQDESEIAWLEHCAQIGPKKSRSRYNKLLTTRFPNRPKKPAATSSGAAHGGTAEKSGATDLSPPAKVTPGSARACETNPTPGSNPKKKKRKHSSSGQSPPTSQFIP